MKCEEWFLILDEYVGNELNTKETGKVALHLADCSTCENYYEELKREAKIYSQYLSDVETSTAIWNNLQVSIKEYQNQPSLFQRLKTTIGMPSFNYSFAIVMIGALVIIGISIVFLKYNLSQTSSSTITAQQNNINRSDESSPPTQNIDRQDDILKPDKVISNAKPKDIPNFIRGKETITKAVGRNYSKQVATKREINAVLQPTTAPSVIHAEQQYLNAIAILERDIKNRRKTVSPQTMVLLEQSDEIIKATRLAVRAKPRDPIAIQYMNAAYDKKVELMRLIATY